MAQGKSHGLKPNLGNHQPEQRFGGPTVFGQPKNADQEKDAQKTAEPTKQSFGAAPFVPQTVMAQAKLQNDQKAAERETENQSKTGELEDNGLSPTNAAITDKTGKEPLDAPENTFQFLGEIRQYKLNGSGLTISPLTREEASELTTDTDTNKIIFNGKHASFASFYNDLLQPKPGIIYKITFTDETGRAVFYMDIKKPIKEKEVTETAEKGSEAAAAPVTPSNAVSQEPAPSEAEAPITSTEAEPSTDDAPKLEESTEGTAEKEAPEAPTGPYWKHEWHVDRFGREALFIWEVGGKRWHNNADRGYAYIRTMTAKVPGDDGYDPRFEQFKRRPNIKEGVNQELNWWFKKTPGWDDPNKKDDGSADFQDLAEFKDAEHNKKGTGFYYVAYVYSPDVYERVAAEKQLRENQKYIGSTKIYQAYVAAEKGIILHQTPFPDDPAYKEKQQSEDKAAHILNKNAPITVIAEGNESSEGWVLVRDATGATGWIERRFISKTRTIEKKHAFPTYTVQPGDTLQGVIQQYYATYPFTTGNDERTVALAIYLFNKNVSGAGIYRNQKKYSNFVNSLEGSVKGYVDPWMKETRANFQSVELYAGGDILLPPQWFIEDMRQRGLVEKRPDFVNSVIEGGRVIQGFVDGVGEGFVDALVGAAEDLYNLVVDIFTGAIFSQLADMFKTIFDLGFEGIWDAIKEFGIATWEEVKAAWNSTNPYVRGKYFGEIIGAILFEVVIALITWGIGTAVTTSARVTRFMTKLPGWLKKFKLIPIPDDAAKHIDHLKKLGDGKKPDLDVPDKKKLDGDTDKKTPDKDKTDSDKDKTDEEKKDQHVSEIARLPRHI